MKTRLLSLLFGLLLVSCAGPTVRTLVFKSDGSARELASYPPPTPEQAGGVIYYLPKRLVLADYVRDYDGNLTTAFNAAQVTYTKAVSDLAGAELDLKLAEGKDPPDAALVKTKTDARKTANITVAITAKALGIATEARETKLVESLRLSLGNMTADTSTIYLAQAVHGRGRDDHFSINVTAEGLLNSANITATDQSGQILVEIANLTAQLAKAAVGIASTPSEKKLKPLVYQAMFDPADVSDVGKFNNDLKAATGSALQVEFKMVPQNNTIYNDGPSQAVDGLLYRRPVNYLAMVTRPADTGFTGSVILQSALFSIPNKGPIGVFRMPAGAFTTTVHNVGFQNGMLVTADSTRPSEVYGLIKVLPQVAKIIVDIPTNLIQLKINQTGNETSLTANQTALLNAQIQLINAQQALLKAQQNAATPPAPTPTPPVTGGK